MLALTDRCKNVRSKRYLRSLKYRSTSISNLPAHLTEKIFSVLTNRNKEYKAHQFSWTFFIYTGNDTVTKPLHNKINLLQLFRVQGRKRRELSSFFLAASSHMKFRLFKIPVGFLIVGILWALFSHSLLASLDKYFNAGGREIIRSLNHLGFVAIAAIVLYFQIKKQQKQILLSEEQYRNLFERNPSPLWISSIDDFRFLKVNKAAIKMYGYSESEFLSMRTMDIVPEEGEEGFINNAKNVPQGLSDRGVWKHKTKKGEIIYASIFTSDLDFKGNDCRLVIAANITDSVVKEKHIKAQNAALHEIAWLNSHEVRKSLCSVISLIQLTKDSKNETERRQYLTMMEQCTGELDEVLIKTNKRVDELKAHSDNVQEPTTL
jgi:PAS domain S-box-containing protein